MNNDSTGSSILRTIGAMGVLVGIAWAFQIVAFGDTAMTVSRLFWVLAAASIAGASVGLMLTAGSLPMRGAPARA